MMARRLHVRIESAHTWYTKVGELLLHHLGDPMVGFRDLQGLKRFGPSWQHVHETHLCFLQHDAAIFPEAATAS